MNYKLMLGTTGKTLLLESLFLLVPMVVSLYYGEDPRPFLITILAVMACGFGLSLFHSENQFFAWESFAAVGGIWLLFCLFGALPFYLSGCFHSYLDCLFESAAGFTTTGATVLTDIECLPRGILFWRSFSSWIGGIGILIFTLAFLPNLGGGAHYLVRAEFPGPVSNKLVPQTARTSKILYSIYIVFTLSELFCLRLAGMPWYHALVTALSTVCTGGFSVLNGSMGQYHLPACEIIITVFLLLSTVNFAVYYLLITGRGRQILKNDELRLFGGVVLVSTVLVAADIAPLYGSWKETLLTALFHVVSIISTTGFTTTDYNAWPELSRWLLLLLMFVGGCAGSTAGGLKCSRVLLLLRCMIRDIRQIAHPRAVKVVKLDGKTVENSDLRAVSSFFVCEVVLIGVGSLLVSMDNFSFTTTFTSVLACISNIGLGLDGVGPLGNYAAFSDLSKLLFTFYMLLGRLEIFPLLILFSPSTWHQT